MHAPGTTLFLNQTYQKKKDLGKRTAHVNLLNEEAGALFHNKSQYNTEFYVDVCGALPCLF